MGGAPHCRPIASSPIPPRLHLPEHAPDAELLTDPSDSPRFESSLPVSQRRAPPPWWALFWWALVLPDPTNHVPTSPWCPSPAPPPASSSACWSRSGCCHRAPSANGSPVSSTYGLPAQAKPTQAGGPTRSQPRVHSILWDFPLGLIWVIQIYSNLLKFVLIQINSLKL
jgi:hypothetical protein